MHRCLLTLLCLLSAIAPARALQEAVYSTETFNQTYIFPNIGQFAPTPEGGLAWDEFAATSEKPSEGKMVEVTFSDTLKSYDAKKVKMRGYMFPLEAGESQSRFLFGPFPMTCFYHFHTPPVLVIEVSSAKPIPFTYEPIVLEGILELESDPQKEPYQRMKDAQPVGLAAPAKLPEKSFHPLFHKRMGMP